MYGKIGSRSSLETCYVINSERKTDFEKFLVFIRLFNSLQSKYYRIHEQLNFYDAMLTPVWIKRGLANLSLELLNS